MLICGFDGPFTVPGPAVAAGTFDVAAWKAALYPPAKDHLPAARLCPAAPVRPGKPGDPFYAVVYAPPRTDARVAAVEWPATGYVVRMKLFHTAVGPEALAQPPYTAVVVPLPVPPAAAGAVPVSVEWSLAVNQADDPYRPPLPGFTPPAEWPAADHVGPPAWMTAGSRTAFTITR